MLPDVIIVNDYASRTGGSSAVALSSAAALARLGARVTLFTAVPPVDAEIAGTPGVELICLHQPEILHDPQRLRAAANGFYNVSAAREFSRLLATRDPARTIVHVHTWTKALSPSVLRAAVQAGFKLVVTLHDFFITCPTGGLFVHRDQSLCERRPLGWDCLTCSCDRRSFAHKLWRSARTFLQNQVLGLDSAAAHYVGVSDFSVARMQQWLPENVPVTIIRNPVDTADLGLPARDDRDAPFVYVGRLAREKGAQLLAEAGQRLGVPAVFVGDGEMRDEIMRQNPAAIITGWLAPDEVVQWMRRARALVFPPLWYETLGLVVVEAAANGVPAIISDRCAATDFVEHGRTGLHFERGSAASLAAAMQQLQQPALAARLGDNAYAWYWNDPWSADRHAHELSSLYTRVLLPPGRKPHPVLVGDPGSAIA
jgi:glycosyltransferase involved in cell wall biosynthesis